MVSMNSLILSFINFLLFIILTILIFRLFRIKKTMNWLVLIFFWTLIINFLLIHFLSIKFDFWVFFSAFLFLFLLFVQIFAIFYKSISIYIIQHLLILKSGSANFNWIHDELIVKESFRRRILELNIMGYIDIEGNNITLTKNGHKISCLLVKIQKYLNIINSG